MKNKYSCSVCDAHHSVTSGKESINEAAQGGKLGEDALASEFCAAKLSFRLTFGKK
jgi:hypothetical protein